MTTNNNIFIVKEEDDLEEIIQNNLFKITVISFVTKETDPSFKLKKCLYKLSLNFKNSMFAYVDMDNYNHINKFKITSIPLTLIIFNQREAFRITGGNTDDVQRCFYDIEASTREVTIRSIKNQHVTAIMPLQQPSCQYVQPQNIPQQFIQQPQSQFQHQQPPPQSQQQHVDVTPVIEKLEALKKTKQTEEKILHS